MKTALMTCLFCLFLAALTSGCVTRTTTSKGAAKTNGLKTNKDGEHIEKQTLWIWQKQYWDH